jgi:ubiquitin C-terminal hydrolase
MYFIDYLFESKKKSFKLTKSDTNDVTAYQKLQFKCNTHWFKSFSPIMDVLYFQIVRQTECYVCKKKNLNFENQSILELDIIDDNDSVHKSIVRYFHDQILDDWTCDVCKAKSDKNILIQRLWFLPQTFIICIKRFKFLNNKMSKLKHPIDIPPTLNFKSTCLQKNIHYAYKLSSVINHIGTSYYGHYNSDLIRSDQSIIKIDDESIIKSNVTLNEQNCYILFYEQSTG